MDITGSGLRLIARKRKQIDLKTKEIYWLIGKKSGVLISP
jgi:hypothetical protein